MAMTFALSRNRLIGAAFALGPDAMIAQILPVQSGHQSGRLAVMQSGFAFGAGLAMLAVLTVFAVATAARDHVPFRRVQLVRCTLGIVPTGDPRRAAVADRVAAPIFTAPLPIVPIDLDREREVVHLGIYPIRERQADGSVVGLFN